MARSKWLAPLSLLLAVVLFLNGCGATRAASRDQAPSTHATQVEKEAGAEKANARDAMAVLWIFGFILIVVAVVIDVVSLPYEAHHHRHFYCTHEVIVVFYR